MKMNQDELNLNVDLEESKPMNFGKCSVCRDQVGYFSLL